MASRARALFAAPMARLTERDWARALIAVAAILQVLMTLRLFAASGEVAGDDMTIHMAEVAAMARSLGDGDFDLWNPSANAGFASGYYYQMAPQLLCALLYLALGWLVSLVTLFKLTCVAALVALPLTTYRALGVLGVKPLAAAAGGFAAGFVFSTSGWGSGIDSLFTSGLYTQAFAMALYPLAAAYAVRYLLGGEHLGRAVAYTLLCGLSHPFIAFALAPAMLVAPWWRVPWPELARRAALLLGAVLATSAPLWLPIVIHHQSFGGFPERVAGEEGIGLTTFGPDYLRGRYLDVGRLPLLSYLSLGALVLGAAVPERRCRLLLPIAGAGLVYAALIVAGPVLPKTRGDLVPAIRFLGPMQVCLAAAAGAGLVTAMALLVPRARAAAIDARIPRWIPAAVVITTCGILGAEVVRGGFARAADQVKTIDDWDLHRDELGQIMDYLRTRPGGRVYADGQVGTGSHWWMYLSYVLADRPAIRAYGGASLQSSPNFAALRYFSLPRHWRHFGVRYALVSKDFEVPEMLAAARRTFATDNYEVWTFPRQSLWSPVLVGERAAGDRDTRIELGVAWMRHIDDGDPRVVIFGDTGVPESLAAPESVRVRDVREERAYHRAVVDVDGDRPALVRLSVSHHPGWRADIDGEPASITQVSPAVMGVVVPPGRHVVRFEFARPWWTWIGWGLLLVAAVVAVARRRLARGARAVAATTAVLVALGPVFAPGDAGAQPSHAPAGVAVDPAGVAVISTSAGVWIRDRPGQPYRYVCPAAAGTEAGAFVPRVAARGSRAIVAGYRGIRAGDSCGLEPMALVNPAGRPAGAAWIESAAFDAGGRLWVATADGTHANDVFAAAGDHLESVGLRSQVRWYLSALPSPSDPSSIYVSGYQVAPPAATLSRSTDGGATFDELAAAGLRLGRSRRSRFVAVDPASAGVAYLVAESVVEPRGDVLYRTADGGARFEVVASPGATITGVALIDAAPKGLWIAVAGPCPNQPTSGQPGCLLRVDPSSGATRAHPGPRLSCLARERGAAGARLVGCRADAASSGIALVAVDDRGRQTPLVTNRELAAPCATLADRCAADWARACKTLGAPCDLPIAEAPAPDAEGTDAEAPDPVVVGTEPPKRPVRWPLLVVLLAALAPLPWLVRGGARRR